MPSARLNLLVLRCADPERSIAFYEALGMSFERHRHAGGPQHYASEQEGLVFEIYPQKEPSDTTHRVRIGFGVGNMNESVSCLVEAGGRIVSPPAESPWGRRAVVQDPDGHVVELTEDPSDADCSGQQ